MGYILESGYVSLNKKGEELCGDKVEVLRDNDSITMVLSDGLGSGVKANILATLTSTMLARMASNHLPIEECVKTIAETLPVCKVRGVAYSTFSLLHLDLEGKGYLVEYDNPQAIFIRDGKSLDLPREKLNFSEKEVFLTKLSLQENDLIYIFSDGAPHAGIGKSLNFGWKRENIIDYIERNYHQEYTASANAALVGDICNYLYLYEPGDDTTISVLKIRTKSTCNVLIGPPANKNDDKKVLGNFFKQEGTKIVCGGTTSKIVSKYLNTTCEVDFSTLTKDIPPIGYINGVDLTTEGVITLQKVLDMSNHFLDIHDVSKKHYDDLNGAALLATELFEKSTHVNLFVGTSINAAHKNLPIDSAMKMKIVEKIKANLEKMGKIVTISYY